MTGAPAFLTAASQYFFRSLAGRRSEFWFSQKKRRLFAASESLLREGSCLNRMVYQNRKNELSLSGSGW